MGVHINGTADASYYLLSNVSCTSSEQYLNECSHDIVPTAECSRVAISCYGEILKDNFPLL